MNSNETVNGLLVDLFNDIIELEEKVLITGEFKNISKNDMHIIDAIGSRQNKNMSTLAKKLKVTVGTITIAINNLVKKGYEFEEMAFEKFLDVAEYYRSLPNFANARTVRNILAQVLMNQNLRTEDMDDEKTIKLEDIEDYLADEGIDLAKPAASKGRIGFV